MTKTLREIRSQSNKRAKTWREKFKDKGGKLIQIPFDKQAIAILDRVKIMYKGQTIGEIMKKALAALEHMTKEMQAELTQESGKGSKK